MLFRSINLERNFQLVPLIDQNWIGYILQDERWLLRDFSGRIYTTEEWLNLCQLQGLTGWGSFIQKLVGYDGGTGQQFFQKPNVRILYDIGLNWKAGEKWPSKEISKSIWEKMHATLTVNYRVSWQQGLDSIDDYIRWIASNRLIITVDSLGLHLATAMNIPVIGLFGSTDASLHDATATTRHVKFDTPKNTYSCMPCWKSQCFQEIHCSEHLNFNKIDLLINELLAEKAQ